MEINVAWKYKEIIPILKTLKTQYQNDLTSFYYAREKNKFIYETKQKVYSWNFDQNKIDRIWEYMNDDLSPLEIFIFFGKGV